MNAPTSLSDPLCRLKTNPSGPTNQEDLAFVDIVWSHVGTLRLSNHMNQLIHVLSRLSIVLIGCYCISSSHNWLYLLIDAMHVLARGFSRLT